MRALKMVAGQNSRLSLLIFPEVALARGTLWQEIIHWRQIGLRGSLVLDPIL
jgi:hypothetical protein